MFPLWRNIREISSTQALRKHNIPFQFPEVFPVHCMRFATAQHSCLFPWISKKKIIIIIQANNKSHIKLKKMVDWYSAIFSPISKTIIINGFLKRPLIQPIYPTESYSFPHRGRPNNWELKISKCLIGTDYLNQQKLVVVETGWSPDNKTYMKETLCMTSAASQNQKVSTPLCW